MSHSKISASHSLTEPCGPSISLLLAIITRLVFSNTQNSPDPSRVDATNETSESWTLGRQTWKFGHTQIAACCLKQAESTYPELRVV